MCFVPTSLKAQHSHLCDFSTLYDYILICYGSMAAMNFIVFDCSKMDAEFNMFLFSNAYKTGTFFSNHSFTTIMHTSHHTISLSFNKNIYLNCDRKHSILCHKVHLRGFALWDIVLQRWTFFHAQWSPVEHLLYPTERKSIDIKPYISSFD